MTICVECGEFELLFVLACGDPAVGEATVLLYGGAEMRELQQEIRTVDSYFTALDRANNAANPDQVAAAQDRLANFLKDYIEPDVQLPSKHLVQAYSITGKKWTRIRSDKMRNHWRSYKIDKSLLREKPAPRSLKQLDTQALTRAFRDVGQKVRDDLRSGISRKGQLMKGQVDGSITDVWNASWLKWVDAVNESMVYSGGSAYHDLSAGAQLLRGYAGFGANLGYNPKTNTYGLSGNAEARAVLAEAKARFAGYVPNRNGWHALIRYTDQRSSQAGRQGEMNFGYFRLSVVITAHAMLGASIMGTAGIEYSPGRGKSLLAKPSMAGAKGEISAGAFAGVEAGGNVKGALEWKNPGIKVEGAAAKPADWAAFFELGAGATASAGIGAQADFYISYEGGKFMFRAKAQLVVGLGAKGEVSGTVGLDAIFDFIQYVYHQLKDNNFAFLHFMSQQAFDTVVKLVLFAIEYGERALKAMRSGVEAAIASIRQSMANAQAAEDYARRVKARPSVLFFAPPEAKGAILYRLSERFTFSFEEHQEAAILTVVGTIQTRGEWNKIVERITPTGQKSSGVAGMMRLRAVLDGGSRTKFEQLIARLPFAVMAGSPVEIRNLA